MTTVTQNNLNLSGIYPTIVLHGKKLLIFDRVATLHSRQNSLFNIFPAFLVSKYSIYSTTTTHRNIILPIYTLNYNPKCSRACCISDSGRKRKKFWWKNLDRVLVQSMKAQQKGGTHQIIYLLVWEARKNCGPK